MNTNLKSLIAQYCQYPSDGVLDSIEEEVNNFSCPVKNLGKFVSDFNEAIDFINRFDRVYQWDNWDGEKTDYLMYVVTTRYDAYFESGR